ncbi:twin-arginine translocation pathway signal protein [Humibacillus sp. DSM 29435]|uniref:amidohydrolase n=1 Tax=Humibacillus sp. DSM 29435 TaxID=1869167 RepID=UPI000871EA30|nr:amidohydrolase [Humibacillus sp. DSM 29435]OFE15375.1 twin-arginine translocation pathway signal protein [Humibacillus sp. DSM 29435]
MRSADTHSQSPADIVFSGGPIMTMDAAGSRPEAVAVRAGRLVAVGSLDEVNALVGNNTEQVDLEGRTLLPGLIDPHMHSAMVQLADWVDVSPMATPTADAVYTALRDATATSTGWVLAQQFDPSITEGHPRLDRETLDRLVPDRPLLVLESNGHIAWVNSAALHRAGVDRDTPDPPAGRYSRDARGELTGRLEESPAVRAFTIGFPLVTGDALVGRIRDLLWSAAGKGATLLHDCGIGSIDGVTDLDGLRRAVDGDSPVRYRGMLVSSEYDAWAQLSLRPGFGDDRFRVDGIKAWSDGSNQAGTGFQREPYLGTDSCGSLNYSPDELAEVVLRAHRDGWQIGVHANGDAAIDVTIDAYERALTEAPRDDHRHRIEHCSMLHPEQIARMAALGLSPSFLIGHVRWWGTAFRDRLLGPERSALYDPCASALRAGLRISLHSDWNVTPLEPLRYVEDAVTRAMAENGEVLNADERINVEAALRAVTIDAAWQCRADDVTGSIEVGKYADLVLLESNPATIDPMTISGIAVSETRLAGEVRYSR